MCFCICHSVHGELFTSSESLSHASILVPCTYKHTMYGRGLGLFPGFACSSRKPNKHGGPADKQGREGGSGGSGPKRAPNR